MFAPAPATPRTPNHNTHPHCRAGTVMAAAAAWGGLAVVQGDGKVALLKEVRTALHSRLAF